VATIEVEAKSEQFEKANRSIGDESRQFENEISEMRDVAGANAKRKTLDVPPFEMMAKLVVALSKEELKRQMSAVSEAKESSKQSCEGMIVDELEKCDPEMTNESRGRKQKAEEL